MSSHLQISTSPRCTWLWTPSLDATAKVRDVLEAAGHHWQALPTQHANYLHVTDVDIGVVAYEACLALAESGYTFSWHPDQHPLNRDDWPSQLPGMPGATAPAP